MSGHCLIHRIQAVLISLYPRQPHVIILSRALRHFVLSLPVRRGVVDLCSPQAFSEEWTESGLKEKRNSSWSETNKVNVLEDEQCF